MTLSFCAVTGTLVAPDGALMPDVQLQFLPAPVAVRGQDGDSLHPRPVSAVADADAAISVELAPGVYTVRTRDVGGREYQPYLIDVPQTPAAILADIMLHLPAPQTVYDAAASARVAAHAAASADTGASLAAAEADAAAASAGEAAASAGEAAASAGEAALVVDVAITRSFASKALAQAAPIPAGVTRIAVDVDGYTIAYRRLSGATALATADGGQWDYESGTLAGNLTVTVPGDYPDMATAIARTAGLKTLPGATITVRQDTTHPITVPIALTGGDYSHYTLAMNPTFSADPQGKLTVGAGFPPGTAVLALSRCRGPRIAFNLDGAGIAERGMVLSDSSLRWVGTAGFFIENIALFSSSAPNGCGIFANDNSELFASGLIVRNSAYRNLHLTGGSRIKAHNSKWRDSGEINIFVTRGCLADFSAGVEVSGGTQGIIIRRSLAALDNVQVSNCSVSGINAENGAAVGARGAQVAGCPSGVISARAAKIDVSEGSIAEATPGQALRVFMGGEISATNTSTPASVGSPALADINVAGFNFNDKLGIVRSENHPSQTETSTMTQKRRYIRHADGSAYAEGEILVNMTSSVAQTLIYPGPFVDPPAVWYSVATDGNTVPAGGSSAQIYGAVSEIRVSGRATFWRIDKQGVDPTRYSSIPLKVFAVGRWR